MTSNQEKNLKFVNMHDAKTNLSKYIEQVNKDYAICRNRVPVGKLVEYKKPSGIKLGLLKDQIKMSDDFDDENFGSLMKI